VVSPGVGAGKSTLLRALLEYAPNDREVTYLRGWHDPFDFLEMRSVESGQRLLVANELSPHLPTYVWGDSARRAFDLIQHAGYGLWATAHASNRDELQSIVAKFARFDRDLNELWDPVVVSLTPTPVHNRKGWSQIAIDLGGNTAPVNAGVSLGSERARAGTAEARHLCHALISGDVR